MEKERIKLLSLFSGIGAFEKALERLGVKYELVGFSEIDKYAVKSYCAIHDVNECMNLGDITKIDESKLPKDINLITYGFPCQDISLAGKQKGLFNEDGSQTRSGLFFDALRIIEDTKPNVAIAENVKNLVGKKFKEQFQIVLDSLEQAGYTNYWKVLNAKNFGIPQNRERVFIVSIRKDVDNGFEFPEGFPLEVRLKDFLDAVVDEKFYLKDEQVQRMLTTSYESSKFENRCKPEDGIIGTLTARDWKDPKCVQVGNLVQTDSFGGNPQRGRVYSSDGISPSLNTKQGGGLEPKIILKENTKQGYVEAHEGDSVRLSHPSSQTARAGVCKGVAHSLVTVGQEGVVVSDK